MYFHQFQTVLCLARGALGFLVLQIWPIFGFCSSVFALKHCSFSVMVSRLVCQFSSISLWFSVFVSNDDSFSDFFYPMHSMVFMVFLVLPCQGGPSTPCSHANSKRPLISGAIYTILPFLLEEWMTSLVCLAAIISGS